MSQAKKNPWKTINESLPKFEVGDVVYTYLTLGDQFINVPARDLPLHAFVHISKAEVVGYTMEVSMFDPLKKFPVYKLKILEVLLECFVRPLMKVGQETTANRWWVEQGDDAYRRYFKKSPRHVEFRFR